MRNHREPWTNEEDLVLNEHFGEVSNEDLSKRLGRTIASIKIRASLLLLETPTSDYAVYKGDKLLAVGTTDEIAKSLGIKKKTVYVYSSPSRVNKAKIKDNLTYAIKLSDGA